MQRYVNKLIDKLIDKLNKEKIMAGVASWKEWGSGLLAVTPGAVKEALFGTEQAGKERSWVNIFGVGACIAVAMKIQPEAMPLLLLAYATPKAALALVGQISKGEELLKDKFPHVLGNKVTAGVLSTAAAAAGVAGAVSLLGSSDPTTILLAGVAPIEASAAGAYVVKTLIWDKCCNKDPAVAAGAAARSP